MLFDKVETLGRVYNGLEVVTNFMRPVLSLVNSHSTDFFVDNHWDVMLPECIRDDLDTMSVTEVKSGLKDFVNGNWRNYRSSSLLLHNNLTFENAKTFQELIIATASLQLSELGLSTPLQQLCFNDVAIYNDESTTTTPSPENVLKLDRIMPAKKTHEVTVMSDFIKKISETADKEKCIDYLVDLGSGKGYLSSYLTLLHKFKVLAVDSSSINSNGCEKRSAKLEKAWVRLLERAAERQLYGKPIKRGKHWAKKTTQTMSLATTNEQQSNSFAITSVNCESQINENFESGESTDIIESSTEDNKLLKTLTQFVTPHFDLMTSIRENFKSFTTTTTTKTSDDDDSDGVFGLVGLHTCGSLGVASLKLFISNENAKFICNVPCCFHLLDEKNLVYPNKVFHDERPGTIPTFPISQKLDVNDTSRLFLGCNSRIMSSHSVPKMVGSEKGLELHPSIFYRSILQLLIKNSLGNEYDTRMNDCEGKSVGKMGDKQINFSEYVRMGLRNLHLDSEIQPTDAEIEDIYNTYAQEGKDRLCKYYLLKSLFSSLVEGIILLDRLAFLLEQDSVAEAHIVELFDASVSPRCHAILALKQT